jgi:hypothetical protein
LEDGLLDDPDAEGRLAAHLGHRYTFEYFRALRAVTADAGLTRIPPVVQAGYLPSGVAQAHRFLWHLDKALLRERSSIPAARNLPQVLRPTFVALASFGAGEPILDARIAGTDTEWNPGAEARADARRRLRRQTVLPREAIEAELDRIAWEGGYRFPDTSTWRDGISRMDRDAQWVWWRIRRRWTYERIAREWWHRHPADFRLQRRGLDDVARKWEAENPAEAGSLVNPAEAVDMVRKAISVFADRARIDVRTGPGRRPPERA